MPASRKPGRPRTANPRTVKVNVRLTAKEARALDRARGERSRGDEMRRRAQLAEGAWAITCG